jgi:hypothetical protein
MNTTLQAHFQQTQILTCMNKTTIKMTDLQEKKDNFNLEIMKGESDNTREVKFLTKATFYDINYISMDLKDIEFDLNLQILSSISKKVKYKGGISDKKIKMSDKGKIHEFIEKTKKSIKDLKDGIYLYCPCVGAYKLTVSYEGVLIKSFFLNSINREDKSQNKKEPTTKKRKNETFETVTKENQKNSSKKRKNENFETVPKKKKVEKNVIHNPTFVESLGLETKNELLNKSNAHKKQDTAQFNYKEIESNSFLEIFDDLDDLICDEEIENLIFELDDIQKLCDLDIDVMFDLESFSL